MKSIALALAASTFAVPAFAGPYVNVETNANYTGSDYTSRGTDLHVGYENNIGDLAFYIQGGKTINAADGVDAESNISGSLVVLSLLQINLVSMVKYLSHKWKTLTTHTAQS